MIKINEMFCQCERGPGKPKIPLKREVSTGTAGEKVVTLVCQVCQSIVSQSGVALIPVTVWGG